MLYMQSSKKKKKNLFQIYKSVIEMIPGLSLSSPFSLM